MLFVYAMLTMATFGLLISVVRGVALPVLAVLLTMVYWLWRVRVRRSLRGIVSVRVPEVVAEQI